MLFVGLLVFGWQFAHGNADPVRVTLPLIELPPIALWQILLATFLTGGFCVAAPMGLGLVRARLEGRRYRKAIRALESELHQLRHIPAAPGEVARVPGAVEEVREIDGELKPQRAM